jgi:diguanylate cyclase (GGDEF)-like protein
VPAAAAATVEEVVRRPDSCYRWGGDEFAILLPETALEDAERVGQRLEAAVRRTAWGPEGHAVSLSLGVATLEAGMEPDALVAEADRRLLASKPDANPAPAH